MNSYLCNYIKFNYINRTNDIGKFYMLPNKFPFILHDKNGCIFIDEKIFKNFVDKNLIRISHSKNGDKINISKGISQLVGYIKCESASSCPKAKFKH